MDMLEKTANKRTISRYKYILIGSLLFLGLIIFKFMRPYLSGFLGAATLYVIVNRQQLYLTQKLHFKRALSALLIILEVLFLFLIPLTGIALLIVDTLSNVTIDPQAIMRQVSDFINSIEEKVGFNIFTPENLSFVPKVGTNVLQVLGNSVYGFVINIFVLLFVLFYMLLNNRQFTNAIREILPFSRENKEILEDETRLIIKANAIGIPLMAIIQGLFAYFGYLFFGVDSALMYAVFTGFVTILPIVGTMVVYVPLAIGFLLSGNYVGGIGLLIYGFVVIGGVDNVARFLLQKQLADIHPLITVFGVLIGIPMFGFWGVIFGPLLLSLFILFFNMFRHEYVPGSEAKPRVTTRYKGSNNMDKIIRNSPIRKTIRKKGRKVEKTI